MNILVVNGNTSEAVTKEIEVEARKVASPGTNIVAVTGRFGARVIGCRSENAIAEHAVLDAIAEHHDGMDAVLVAVSLDTAVGAAREALTVPVVGMTEAALWTACMLGERIGLVLFDRRLAPLYAGLVARYGVRERVAATRVIETAPGSVLGQRETVEAEVARMAEALSRDDGAEVVIVVGAVAAGMPRRLQERVPVPLLDGVSCGILQAELLVRLGPQKPSAGSFALPRTADLTGVSGALRSLLRA